MKLDLDLDRQQLQALAILHYVLGGLTLVLSIGPVLMVVFAVFIMKEMNRPPGRGGAPAGVDTTLQVIGWGYGIAGGVSALTLWLLALLAFVAARSLGRHRRRTLCLVTAAVSCLFVPVGTILGIFTIIVLVRPSVRHIFEAAAVPPAQQELALS